MDGQRNIQMKNAIQNASLKTKTWHKGHQENYITTWLQCSSYHSSITYTFKWVVCPSTGDMLNNLKEFYQSVCWFLNAPRGPIQIKIQMLNKMSDSHLLSSINLLNRLIRVIWIKKLCYTKSLCCSNKSTTRTKNVTMARNTAANNMKEQKSWYLFHPSSD